MMGVFCDTLKCGSTGQNKGKHRKKATHLCCHKPKFIVAVETYLFATFGPNFFS